MAIQKTRWSPDTCGCIVEYTWDDTISQDARVHTIDTIVNRCPAHAGIATMNSHWITLTEENPRKNKMLGQLMASYPILTTTDAQGNVMLKEGVVIWSFDTNRVLQISAPSLTASQKSSAQKWADTNLGAGKVKIN